MQSRSLRVFAVLQKRLRDLWTHRSSHRLAFSAVALPGLATAGMERAAGSDERRRGQESKWAVEIVPPSSVASSKASLSSESEKTESLLRTDKAESSTAKSTSVDECTSDVSATSCRSDRNSETSRDESISAQTTVNATRRGGRRLHAGRKSNREPVYGLSTTRCIVANCTTYASYGDPVERLKLYVKEVGSIMIQTEASALASVRSIDIREQSISRIAFGCSSRATYGSVGNSTKSAGEDQRLCEAQNCKKIPAFGDPRSGSPRFCREHKLAFHVDVKNKKHMVDTIRTSRKNASHAARMENRVLMISSIDAMPNAWSFMNVFTHEAN
ncbi:hypothetical protein GUITHDRAFT_112571 [Guillardia theta CCMP2712]|uniref:Uncharacterized protein n=1 Tax=Guillardia theta (strain CCMP2712) TaxID=905079 RepID=L1IYQ8_GUITC|nr:hypothetical protein GUITHDRAFT_112571 [Guillardia theta CCMP2712]EKX41361.1 hypothetical protein GUITHDRAFT_112571 [Guillardia theta CCMP2712]|eukprot:XP_005828341.1 hypothetical protein GUITHDRAFT_112571 [Guillardia theta CCMP2712]